MTAQQHIWVENWIMILDFYAYSLFMSACCHCDYYMRWWERRGACTKMNSCPESTCSVPNLTSARASRARLSLLKGWINMKVNSNMSKLNHRLLRDYALILPFFSHVAQLVSKPLPIICSLFAAAFIVHRLKRAIHFSLYQCRNECLKVKGCNTLASATPEHIGIPDQWFTAERWSSNKRCHFNAMLTTSVRGESQWSSNMTLYIVIGLN